MVVLPWMIFRIRFMFRLGSSLVTTRVASAHTSIFSRSSRAKSFIKMSETTTETMAIRIAAKMKIYFNRSRAS